MKTICAVERPCPPPPPEAREEWPPSYNHRSLIVWWEYYLAFLAGWAWWASTDTGGYLQ